MNLVFSSRVPSQCREALEELLFFNPQQHRARAGILESLEQFGQPRLEESAQGLSVRVGNHEAQTLFAYDRDRRAAAPIGLVVFIRTNSTDMSIMHVAVHPDYSLHGKHAGVGLGVTLVEKVREIAVRIVGIKRIVFFYRQEVVIKL